MTCANFIIFLSLSFLVYEMGRKIPQEMAVNWVKGSMERVWYVISAP